MIENDFSKGNVCRHILMQAVPLTIAQLIQLLYNVVDRIYIGHLPGTQGEALTGVGLVFPIISMIAAFTNLFSMGGAPLFSIARGEGDEKKASYILNNTFTMLVITAFVLMAVGYGWKRPILYLFGASDVTYPFANDYLTIYLAGTLFLMIGTGMNSFISAEGFPKTGMLVVICGAVINIALDPLFIFVEVKVLSVDLQKKRGRFMMPYRWRPFPIYRKKQMSSIALSFLRCKWEIKCWTT